MIIGGVTCFMEPWPRPRAIPAIEWNQLDSGFWRPTVRGFEADQYFSDIVIYDDQDVIDTLWAALKSSRGQLSVTFLDTTESRLFGDDITPTAVTVWKYGVPAAAGFTGQNKAMYRLALTLRAVTYSFAGTGAWPSVLRVQPGWKTGSTFEINKLAAIGGAVAYSDTRSDTPYFEGEFLQFPEEMKKIRRFIMGVNRGAQTTFPDIGVPYPFGSDLPGFGGSYVRIIAWEDMGRQDYQMSKIKIGLSYDGNNE